MNPHSVDPVSYDVTTPFKQMMRKLKEAVANEASLHITNDNKELNIESSNLILDGVAVVALRGFECVTFITEEFLADSEDLREIEFGRWDSLSAVSPRFLRGCTNIVHLDLSGISSGITEVGPHFLSGCIALETVVLMEMTNVKTIGTDFMKGCSSLTTVQNFKVGDTTVFEGTIFDGCTSLQHCDLSTAVSLKKEENCSSALLAQSQRHFDTLALPPHLIVIELPTFNNCSIAQFHSELEKLPSHALEANASTMFEEILNASTSITNESEWAAYLQLYHWFINTIPADNLLQLGFKKADRYTAAEDGTLLYVPLTPNLPDVLMLHADGKLVPMMPATSATECRECVKITEANLFYTRHYDFGAQTPPDSVILRTPSLLRVAVPGGDVEDSVSRYMSSPYSTLFQQTYEASKTENYEPVVGDANTLAWWRETLELHRSLAAHNILTTETANTSVHTPDEDEAKKKSDNEKKHVQSSEATDNTTTNNPIVNNTDVLQSGVTPSAAVAPHRPQNADDDGNVFALLQSNEDVRRQQVCEEEERELMEHVAELQRTVIQFDLSRFRSEKDLQTRNITIHWFLKCLDAISALDNRTKNSSKQVDPNTFYQLCRVVRELMDIVQSPKHLILMFRVIQRFTREDSMHIFCQKTTADQLLRLGTFYNECNVTPTNMLTDRLYGAALRAITKLKEDHPFAGETMSSGASTLLPTMSEAANRREAVLYCTLTLKEIVGNEAIAEHMASQEFLEEVKRREYVYFKCSESRLDSPHFEGQSILKLDDFLKTRSAEAMSATVMQLYGGPLKDCGGGSPRSKEEGAPTQRGSSNVSATSRGLSDSVGTGSTTNTKNPSCSQ